MREVVMISVTKIRGDYTGCNFQYAKLQGGEFADAVLDRADFGNAELYYDTLKQAKSLAGTIVPDHVYQQLRKDGHQVRCKGENP